MLIFQLLKQIKEQIIQEKNLQKKFKKEWNNNFQTEIVLISGERMG